MPLRITSRKVTGSYFGATVTVVIEQRLERVQDPSFPIKPAVLTTGAGDDTALQSIDRAPNTPPANFAYMMWMLGSAVANGAVFASHGDSRFLSLVKPYADFGQGSVGGGYPEIDRIITTYNTWLLDHWHEENWNETVQAWALAMRAESPRTMVTIQEWIDKVDKWGDATANLVLPSVPDATTPLWQVAAVQADPATPQARFAAELDRISKTGPGTRPVENTRWRQIANDVGPATTAGLVALDIAGWVSATYDETMPARVTEYQAWATRM
ncbi:MAG TPA: hypothetical protein PKL08_18150, partial [Thermoanaerobaculaceae bacterium]|nr:hypothetical protein [Thermoanaerobaculaceae bacterium]